MMSLTFGLFTQVSRSGLLGPLVLHSGPLTKMLSLHPCYIGKAGTCNVDQMRDFIICCLVRIYTVCRSVCIICFISIRYSCFKE